MRCFPKFEMRPATGPLQTGTYISELVEVPGRYTTVKDDRSKLTLTDESRTEDAVKVSVFNDL